MAICTSTRVVTILSQIPPTKPASIPSADPKSPPITTPRTDNPTLTRRP